MIGGMTVNPREGDRRQKALQKALAARASALSRTASTGQGRGARTGAGVRVIGQGARPGASLSFLSAKGPNGFGPGGVNFFGANPGLGALVAATQLPTQALPSQAQGNPPGPVGGPVGGGPPPFSPPAMGTPQYQDAAISAAGGDPEASDFLNGLTDIDPFPSSFAGSGGGLPGGLIPLGGGVFYDPDTGQLRGGGLV